MKTDVKWFVEIVQNRGHDVRIEACASLREAREIAEEIESGFDFDDATDSIVIYRGESWVTASFLSKTGRWQGNLPAAYGEQ